MYLDPPTLVRIGLVVTIEQLPCMEYDMASRVIKKMTGSGENVTPENKPNHIISYYNTYSRLCSLISIIL